MLLKPGLDPLNPGSYRPISISSIIGKLYDIVLGHRITAYLENQASCKHTKIGLNDEQYGFRPGRQTHTGLFICTEAIKQRAREGKRTWVLSLDIKTAFPSANHAL